MRKVANGMMSGVSDLIVIRENEILFFECKTDIGKQSEKQKEFQYCVENLGFKYFIVRSLSEFKNKILILFNDTQ